MKRKVKRVYDALDTDPPEQLDSGQLVWTTVDGVSPDGTVHCLNPASNDSRSLRLPQGGYPDEIAEHPIFTEAGNIHPEVRDIPVSVIVRENYGGHLEGWIRSWTTDPDELREEDIFEAHKREEQIEWEGTGQTIDEEEVRRRTSVFTEADPRGSKNDLIK